MASGWRPLGVEARVAEGDTLPLMVPLGDDVAVPRRFTATFTNGSRVVTLHVRVNTGGRGQPVAEVERVEVARVGGRELYPSDPQGLPWGELFDQAVAAGAAFGVARQTGGEWLVFADPAAVEQAARRLRRRAGRRLTPEHLALVLEVAAANPKRPEAAVAEAWGVQRTTAQYWLRRARETRTQSGRKTPKQGGKR
jgi:hypothetical protein